MMDNIQEYQNNLLESIHHSEIPLEDESNNSGKKYFERLRDALSVRAKNILLDNELYDYDDFLLFISSGNHQFANLRNCGNKTIKELEKISSLLLCYQKDPSSILNIPIEDLGLSVRPLNCLKAAGIDVLGELVVLNKADLIKFHNMGKKSLQEIEEAVISKGLWFGFDIKTFLQGKNTKPKDVPDGDSTILKDATENDEQDEIVDTSVLNVPIEDLGLSVRSFNCLETAGIKTLGDLVAFEKEDLFKFRNLGRKSIQEIEDVVVSKGLMFGMVLKNYHKEKAIKQQTLESLISNTPVLRNYSRADLDYIIAFKEKYSHHPMIYLLYKSLSNLTEREQKVVMKVWGMKNFYIQPKGNGLPLFEAWSVEPTVPMSIDEIAAESDLTRERTRQIYEKAIRRIKHWSTGIIHLLQLENWGSYETDNNNPFFFISDLKTNCIIEERDFLIEYIQNHWNMEGLFQFAKDVPCISKNYLFFVFHLKGFKAYWIDYNKKELSAYYLTTDCLTPDFYVDNRLKKYNYNRAIKEVLRLQKVKKTESIIIPIVSYFIDNENYWNGIRPTGIEKEKVLWLLIWLFKTLCDVQIENDTILVEANKIDYSGKIYEILKTAGVRLHRDEIFYQLQTSCFEMGLPCKFNDSSQITPFLTKDPRIISIGKSSFWGLKEWGELVGSIREIAVEIVKKAEEPVQIQDITKQVLESRPDSNEKSVSSIIWQTIATGELLLFCGDHVGCPNRKYKDDYILMPQTFDDWLKSFKDFVLKNKRFPAASQGYEGYLYRWYQKASQLTELTSEEILKIDALEKELVHYPHNMTEYNFLHNCNLYKKFVEGNNRTPKKEDDSDLYMWFYITSRNYTSYKDNRNKYFSQLLQYLSDKLY